MVAVHALQRRLALGLPGELLQELRQRLAQLLHQALDLLVAGAVAQRLLQLLLRRPQRALGVGQIAVLDPQRHVPQLGDHAVAAGARILALQAPVGRPQAQKHLQVVDEALRLRREGIERLGHQQPVARILHQPPALLDHGARQQLGEAPLGQRDLDRLALADLSGEVLGDQGELHLHAGPGMVADLVQAVAFGQLGIGARQVQRQHRRPLVGQACALLRLPRPRGRGGVLLGHNALDARLGRDDAIVVLDLVEQLEAASRRALRLLGQSDLRHDGRA